MRKITEGSPNGHSSARYRNVIVDISIKGQTAMTGSLSKSSAVLHAIALTIALALISGHYNLSYAPIANKLPASVVQSEPDSGTIYPEISELIK